jgi:hypothetical protein
MFRDQYLDVCSDSMHTSRCPLTAQPVQVLMDSFKYLEALQSDSIAQVLTDYVLSFTK